MDCNTCKEKKKSLEPVPYIVHESAMARQERNNKRLWIVVIILIAALILSNAAWVYYESQFEVVETKEVTQDVDTGDGDAIVSGIGDVNYGESETDSQNNETPSP
jgi:cytoskeletal protein RodZ